MLESAEEHAWVWSTASGMADHDWWIGLDDRAVDDQFDWIDGTPCWHSGTTLGFGYVDWGPDQPDDAGACVEMEKDWDGSWDDEPCDDTDRFVCEGS